MGQLKNLKTFEDFVASQQADEEAKKKAEEEAETKKKEEEEHEGKDKEKKEHADGSETVGEGAEDLANEIDLNDIEGGSEEEKKGTRQIILDIAAIAKKPLEAVKARDLTTTDAKKELYQYDKKVVKALAHAKMNATKLKNALDVLKVVTDATKLN